jgi:hypothetical protein
MTDLMRFYTHPFFYTAFCLLILSGYSPILWSEETINEAPESEEQSANQDTSTESEPLIIPERTQPHPQASRFDALESELRLTSDQEWVELGTDAFTPKGLLTLHRNKVVRGTVLLYPDSGTHQDWPRITHALREQLPTTGWNTLVLPIPKITTLDIPKRTLPTLKLIRVATEAPVEAPEGESQPSESVNADEASESEQTDTTPTDTTEENLAPAQESLESDSSESITGEQFTLENVFALNSSQTLAAMQRAQALGDFPIVILGIGDGSVWAARAAQTLQNQARVSLMMIDPAPLKNSDQNTLSLIAQLDLPVMDIDLPKSTQSRLSENTQSQQQRQAIANRADKAFYLTARIPQQAWSRNQSDWLVRYIDGRLRTLIAIEPIEEVAPDGQTQPLSNIPPGGQG